MNRLTLAIGAALVLLAAKAFAQPAPAADRIAALVSALSTNQLWMNGMTPHLRLGADASPSEVLDRCFQMMRFDAGPIEDYKIVAVRDVLIAPEDKRSPKLTAVLVESNLGPKIVLMRFEGTHWWTRAFDAR
ncbi:hypothetical protein F2P45_06140 [Massilia sp. CCM 8733]|uniref:Uncharacterized protein n=1 Tax=Massilia mucilaginosa TaxID=2609282 RepID=A0ABX0NPB4_9BURK|nr:hypothetical protein [Massilia mucilaginosa]NHZ88605.1 hypothetical protein [Massilia mucilaginosa]